MPPSLDLRASRTATATMLLLVAVLLFVANGELMEDEAAASYQKPAALIWFIHSAMLIMWIYPAARRLDSKRAVGRLTIHSLPIIELAMEYFACNYLFVCALPAVGLADTNAVYQAGIAFVYLLSIPMLGEAFSHRKSLAVVMTIGGFLLMLPRQSEAADSQKDPAQPHVVALGWVSATCASAVNALFKVRCKQILCDPFELPDNTAASSVRLLGLLGGSTLLYVWPVLVVLHLSSWELFELPSNVHVAGMLIVIAALAVSVNTLSTWALALSSPLFMSVGFAFSIPFALLADVVIRGASVSGMELAGITLIVVSLCVMASAIGEESKEKAEPLLITQAVN